MVSKYLDDFDLKQRLVDKSIEAYVLALETINRLTIQYRLETFCYLFCNAWELLLKAKILADAGDPEAVFYKVRDGKPKRALSLKTSLDRLMPNRKDPIRRNIERVEELRDESVHLVISQIPSDLIRLFQAGMINYHKLLDEWFNQSLADRYPLGMMSLVYDLSPEQSDLSDLQLRRKLGYDAAEFLTKYCAALKLEFDELQRPAEFSIGLEYRITLTKKQEDADTELSSGATDDDNTRIVQVAKDSSESHPYRQKEVVDLVRAETQINPHDIQCINKVYGIKGRPEYFYRGKVAGSPGQYSQAFVDWILREYRKDNQFFSQARVKARKQV